MQISRDDGRDDDREGNEDIDGDRDESRKSPRANELEVVHKDVCAKARLIRHESRRHRSLPESVRERLWCKSEGERARERKCEHLSERAGGCAFVCAERTRTRACVR
eukprot:6206471-Pleurochrysis_carterae.AAC.1